MVQTRLRASYRLMKILSVEILRGLYFPSGDLMSSELGSRPSEIWRAMIEGHEVLKLCLIKWIGMVQVLLYGMIIGYLRVLDFDLLLQNEKKHLCLCVRLLMRHRHSGKRTCCMSIYIQWTLR
jgi:hypothetical protein